VFVSRIKKELFERELTRVGKFKLENNLFYLSKYNVLLKKKKIIYTIDAKFQTLAHAAGGIRVI